MRPRDEKAIGAVRRPIVYNVFQPEPALVAQLYDGVRCRSEGTQVVALGYDASSKSSPSGGPWSYSNAAIVFHRRGHREISYRRRAWSGHQLVGDGEVSMIPAGYELDVDYREPCEGLVIAFSNAMLGSIADELGNPGDFPARFGLNDAALLSMAESFWHSATSSRRFLDALGRAMALHIMEHHAHAHPSPAPPPEWLKLAINHVRRHLDRPISLDEMADAAGLSRAHFARCFKRETGISPHEHVVMARTHRARELILDDPNRSLAAVASAAGFCDQSHLTGHFRRVFGVTPAAFRKRPHDAPRD